MKGDEDACNENCPDWVFGNDINLAETSDLLAPLSEGMKEVPPPEILDSVLDAIDLDQHASLSWEEIPEPLPQPPPARSGRSPPWRRRR